MTTSRRAPVYSRRGAAPRVRPLKTTERYFGCKQRIRGLSGANDFANRSARLGDLAERDRCRKGCRRAQKLLSCANDGSFGRQVKNDRIRTAIFLKPGGSCLRPARLLVHIAVSSSSRGSAKRALPPHSGCIVGYNP